MDALSGRDIKAPSLSIRLGAARHLGLLPPALSSGFRKEHPSYPPSENLGHGIKALGGGEV